MRSMKVTQPYNVSYNTASTSEIILPIVRKNDKIIPSAAFFPDKLLKFRHCNLSFPMTSQNVLF